jgi:hypothetical protein
MFAFGEKVIVDDVSLKSHNKMGLFVGMNQQGKAKVYLEEPMITGKKTVVACISIAPEKLRRYLQSEQDRIYERLAFLNERTKELNDEMKAIDDEVYHLELKLMGRE